MKNFLLQKLKSEFFVNFNIIQADQKNRRKYKHPAHIQNEPEKPLTK